jgi:hypothetical protein
LNYFIQEFEILSYLGDSNKLAVHELGATPKLFALTSHEERTIQRNATMAFGLLSANSKSKFFNILKAFKKIKIYVCLLYFLTPENCVNFR